MNKKILAIAVAAAIAAPMAVQADVTVNGAVSRDMWSDSTATGLVGGDAGTSKLEINAKQGNAFAKVAFDIRNAAFGTTVTDSAAATHTAYGMGAREQYAGVKAGGVNIMLGRLSNAYNGGVKVDTMTANFLESRARKGGVGKVSSFVSGLLGVSGNAGDVSYAVQYGPAYSDMAVDAGGTAKNPIMANVKFKAGPVGVGVGVQQDAAGNTSTGLSAKMKFGGVAIAASYEAVDGAYVAGCAAATACSVLFVDAGMAVGNGTVGLGVGSNTDASTTFTRLSYQMKIDAATVTVGTSSADGDTRTGAGLKVAF